MIRVQALTPVSPGLHRAGARRVTTHAPFARDASAPAWFRSGHSSRGDGNDCVEVAVSPTTVHIRDSRNPDGPRLVVTPTPGSPS
ncbi:DUF397 domain-containing protein [Streptomyces sp. enrichment culture]|uniref:DUF397 domain-containing protein n=1 Tax=Streptomyces sp. enrichment culture TaxID=1795815 RepID=UPI003F57F6BC